LDKKVIGLSARKDICQYGLNAKVQILKNNQQSHDMTSPNTALIRKSVQDIRMFLCIYRRCLLSK
ncbi:MAG: hypothetical protein ACTHWG_07855, partial [Psychrobacter sp.]